MLVLLHQLIQMGLGMKQQSLKLKNEFLTEENNFHMKLKAMARSFLNELSLWPNSASWRKC